MKNPYPSDDLLFAAALPPAAPFEIASIPGDYTPIPDEKARYRSVHRRTRWS